MSHQYEEFQFPAVEPGEVVMFMMSPGDTEAHPMFVTAVGDQGIDGMVFFKAGGSQNRSGVRHVTDPFLQIPQNIANMIDDDESGVFVEHPHKLAAQSRLEQIDALTTQLEALEELTAGLAQLVDPDGKQLSELLKESRKKAAKSAKKSKVEEDAPDSATTTGVRLSDVIGGAGGPVDSEKKRAALASAR